MYYGILLDVTKRKETEEALRLAQFAFDNVNIGIQSNTSDARFVEVNKSYTKLIGYSREELKTMSLLDIEPTATKESLAQLWQELKEKGENVHKKFHCRKDGALIPVEIYASFLEYEGQEYAFSFVQDITERKRMEQALKESEERLDLALKSANEGIWDWHIEPDILYLDARYYTIAGYQPNDFPATYDEILKRVHQDDLGQVRSANDRYLAGQQATFDVEFRFLRKDGDYMWIKAKGEIVAWDKEGKPTRFIGTNADIDKRRMAEETLRENEQLLNNILESMNEGILVLDRDFKCTIYNHSMRKMRGRTKEQVIGKIPWESLPTLAGTPAEKSMREAMSGKTIRDFEYRMPAPDGKMACYSNNFTPLKDDHDNIIGIVGVVSDITQHKKDEEELHRLQSYLSNIIDSMPSILIAVDRDGNVTQWNNRTEQTTGLRFSDAHSRSLTEVFPRLADEMDRIRSSIRDRKVITSSKVPHKTAHEFRFEDITIFPLVANGVEGAVIRVDDVTERVRLEEMMIQSEKMLSVGGLAAGLAHEINNPLAGMLQTAGVMANRLSTQFNIPANRKAAEAAGTTMEAIEQFMAARGIPRMLDAINESGRRAATIVNNVLSFARKSDATVSTHHLAELLDKAEQLAATDYDLKKKYDFKQIDIQRDYAQDLPAVPCEGAKIQQVLLNILRNGAQAMQAAGTRSPRFVFRTRFEPDQDMAVMEIEDNGPGMDEPTRKRVFEPFFTSKPVGTGTGLGLSVSFFIITENHHGDMAVVSSPGAGAKFIIRLPIRGPNHREEIL